MAKKVGHRPKMSKTSRKTQYFILLMYDDVVPCLLGPYKTQRVRDAAAQHNRDQEGDRTGVYSLDIRDNFPKVDTYSSNFLEQGKT